jgi:hypothetical protein
METKMDPQRIDIKKLTLAQLALITPIIEEYLKAAYSSETKKYTAEEIWVEFTDPETGLKYDLDLYCDNNASEFMAVDMFNVVKDPNDPTGQLFTTDMSVDSLQKAWDSRLVTFEEWVSWKKREATSIEVEITVGLDVASYATFTVAVPPTITEAELVDLVRERDARQELTYEPDFHLGENLRVVSVETGAAEQKEILFENIPVDSSFSDFGRDFLKAMEEGAPADERIGVLLSGASSLDLSKPELARRLLNLFEDNDALQVLRDAAQEDKPAAVGPRP